uniref:Uncharacterized protein n=1 Tax=Anguilla anguilla TaxID=7936 RepID=A0A0E9QLF2_ANGAN
MATKCSFDLKSNILQCMHHGDDFYHGTLSSLPKKKITLSIINFTILHWRHYKRVF